MTDAAVIYGCFPDVHCLATVLAQHGSPIDISSVIWSFAAIGALVIAIGLLAAHAESDR